MLYGRRVFNNSANLTGRSSRLPALWDLSADFLITQAMCKILFASLNQGSLDAIHSRHLELSARQWESWIILANLVRELAPLEDRVSAVPS